METIKRMIDDSISHLIDGATRQMVSPAMIRSFATTLA